VTRFDARACTAGCARPRVPRAGLLGALVGLLGVALAAQEPLEPLLETGRYGEVVSRLEDGVTVQTVEPLARALVALGRYEDAERELRRLEKEEGFRAFTTLGDVLMRRGKSDAAREAYRQALRRGGADALTARLGLAVVDRHQGRLESAREGFYALIDAYNRALSLSAAELTAVGRACQALGNENHQLFKDALKAYDEALAADPSALEPRVHLGELFLEKYDSTEARTSIRDVLEVAPSHAEALLVMAQILRFDGSPEAMQTVDRALETNPSLVSARVFRAELLLELEDYDEARAEALRALEINLEALDAKAVLAATHFLQGEEEAFARVEAEVLGRNTHYAGFYNLLADASVRNRLYREAVEFARRAVEVDSKSWRGHGLEGLNLLRIGEIEEGRRKLELAFEGDPYNVWIKNTLDLLDTFADYRSRRTPRFELFIHGDEADLLAPLLGTLAEEAYDALAERYGFTPPTPIRVEVFPSHADFSVRTVGLAGLGALGVCFGPVIAVDSPSAREIGSFNWGSTFWHELAHTFTLTASEHKVPRWLTEGLSVLEERRARRGWGDDPRPDFLRALEQGELLGLGDLNNGFVRPDSPSQIVHSYYQASLLAELIEDEYGFDKVLAILRGYADGSTTEQLFERVLEVDLDSFDELFFRRLEERFAGPLAALGDADEEPPSSEEELRQRAEASPGDFRSQLAWGTRLVEDERWEEALPFLERAKALFPEYAGAGSAYLQLAGVHRRAGRLEAAAAELEAAVAINETDYESHRTLAGLYRELGRPQQELGVLERLLFVYPKEAAVHMRMAELYRELDRPQGVIRARRAVVALGPPDRADALYRLARAHFEAGEMDDARRQVLLALELAPGFAEAQRLLLDLHRGES
jgi:tetratricopeptide (TPR) repeat protein